MEEKTFFLSSFYVVLHIGSAPWVFLKENTLYLYLWRLILYSSTNTTLPDAPIVLKHLIFYHQHESSLLLKACSSDCSKTSCSPCHFNHVHKILKKISLQVYKFCWDLRRFFSFHEYESGQVSHHLLHSVYSTSSDYHLSFFLCTSHQFVKHKSYSLPSLWCYSPRFYI